MSKKDEIMREYEKELLKQSDPYEYYLKYVLKNGQVVNRDPSKYKYNKENMKWRLFGSGSKKYIWHK